MPYSQRPKKSHRPIDATYKTTLLASPLFEKVEEEDIEKFMSETPVIIRKHPKNSFIALINEPMEGIGVILQGHAHLTRENMLGQRSIVTDLYESDMFGEALLFTDQPLWPATIETTEPTVVLFIPFDSFVNLAPGLERIQNQLLLNLLHDLSQKALQLNRKVHYLSIKSMREKIYAYFRDIYKRQKNLRLHLPHNRQEMADILNVSRPSMSRELGRLVDEGIIQLDRSEVLILKPDEVDIELGPKTNEINRNAHQ